MAPNAQEFPPAECDLHDKPELNNDDAKALRAAIDAAVAYRVNIDSRPVGPKLGASEMASRLAAPLPEMGTEAHQVIAELAEQLPDGLAQIASPRFFGYVMGGGHPAGIAADMLGTAWHQPTLLASLTPAMAAVETLLGQWLIELFGLPSEASFGICTGATMANVTGLAAARNALLKREDWDVEADGLFGAPEIHVVVGAEAHSSVFSALRLLGFGASRVTKIEADSQGRMQAYALAKAVARVEGPMLIIAQAGNINSGAIDPLAAIAKIARTKNAWLHVDGAFGLWAKIHPDLSGMIAGVEHADSWAVDGHKWLQTPYDSGFIFVRDAEAHRRAMSQTAAYLDASQAQPNPGDYVPELSRRPRGLAAYAVLKAMGRDGLVEMIGRHCALARHMADRLAAEPGISVLNDVTLNQIAVAFGNADQHGDAATEAVLKAVQAEGICYPSGGNWQGRHTLRLSVSNHATTQDDADRSVDAIITAWRDYQKSA